jgi:hypothetical protein
VVTALRRSFEKRIQNRVTEGGASNALFFYSQCNRFIAKSCTAQEMMQVRENATALRNYFVENKQTYITKVRSSRGEFIFVV